MSGTQARRNLGVVAGPPPVASKSGAGSIPHDRDGEELPLPEQTSPQLLGTPEFVAPPRLDHLAVPPLPAMKPVDKDTPQPTLKPGDHPTGPFQKLDPSEI